jgi:hypothetical protein
MPTVNDNANEIIRKSTRIIRPDDYRLLVDVDNLELTPFNELKTAARVVQVELKSNVGTVSPLRNEVTTTNGAVEINASGEYRVYTNNLASAVAELQSGARGRYIPGYQLECGIGIRIPTQTLTGTQKIEWGYFDEDDGIGYGLDATGLYVFIKRLGVLTKTYQSEFSNDTLDGSNTTRNPSGATLDLADGNIFQMEFVWYGYGTVQWHISVRSDADKRGSTPVLVHSLNTRETTSVSQPNLPVTVNVQNGTSATGVQAFVGGRQVSIYGQTSETYRINGEYVLAKSAPINVWTPIISFRRKTGRGSNQTVKVNNFEIISNQEILVTFVSGHSLTGASFGNFQDVSTNDTVVEVDRAATAITGGNFFGGYSFASASRTNQSQVSRVEVNNFEFVNDDIVSLVVKPLTTNATIQAIFDIQEQW